MSALLFRSLFVCLLFVASPVVAAELRPFDAKSMDVIRQAQAGKPFVLAFWSVTCEPCRDEMGQWGALQRKYPKVPIVLVATDPPGDRAAAKEFLARYDLGKVQTWMFNDEFDERVRFAVDRRWRGELPRTYFYDAAHHAEGRSGRVDHAWMEQWLAQQSAKQQR